MTASNGAGAAMAVSASDKPRARRGHYPGTAWCPDEHIDFNRKLQCMGYSEAERQEIILAEVPGTDAYKRRMAANARDAARLPGLGFAQEGGR